MKSEQLLIKQSKSNIFKYIIVILLILVACYIYVLPYLFPSFEINNLKTGDFVKETQTISGHGAIPSSKVSVYVIDDLGHKWLQNTINTTEDGEWTCEGVIFGEDRRGDIGKDFTVYATLNKDNTIYETPHVTVTRS